MTKEAILSVLLTISLALTSFSLKWTFDANAKIELLQEQVKQLANNNDKDVEQDRQLKLLWKYSTWLHGQANTLRFKLNMEPESPNFN